jgi:hypothetical protein
MERKRTKKETNRKEKDPHKSGEGKTSKEKDVTEEDMQVLKI